MLFTDKRVDETDLQYQKRLLYAKLVDRSLNIEYPELSKLIYGRAYAPDVARRMAYGSLRTLKLLEAEQKSALEAKGLLDDLERKQKELFKERKRYQDQRREYFKLLTAESRTEHLHDVIMDAANELKREYPLCYTDAEITMDFDEDKPAAVLVLSDWHFGMVTDNAFNKYNTEVCAMRAEHIMDAAIQRLALHKCGDLHIVILDDMVHGAIHTSARVASEEITVNQLMKVSELLAQMISVLSMYADRTIVHATYGNHGRTVQNKHDSIHRDNMERVIPWWLEERFSGASNIKVVSSDDEFLLIKAAGHDIVAAHGDLDHVKSSVRILPELFRKKYGSDPEYIILGDKHHRESIEELGVTAVICGALCGTDDYANEKRLFSTPSQLMLIVNKKDGVDAEYHLRCE